MPFQQATRSILGTRGGLPESVERRALLDHGPGGVARGEQPAAELESVSPPGYHFHSLTDDEQGGGHVLDCQLTRGTVEIDLVTDLQLAFDPNP